MAESFTKLFSSLTRSTIWDEDNETRIIWITLLALADQHGYVGGSVPGLAHEARLTVGATQKALDKLAAPDKDSRTKDHQGRRIEFVDRGWFIINYRKFRDLRDDDVRRAYERTRKRQQRQRNKQAVTVELPTTVRDMSPMSHDVPAGPAMSAQAEAERAEADQEQDPSMGAVSAFDRSDQNLPASQKPRTRNVRSEVLKIKSA